MTSDATIVDMTHAKSALAVRQTFAAALGFPLEPDITWDSLRERMLNSSTSMPKRLLFKGMPALAIAVPEEERTIRAVLKELGAVRSDVEIRIVIHG